MKNTKEEFVNELSALLDKIEKLPMKDEQGVPNPENMEIINKVHSPLIQAWGDLKFQSNG